MGIALGNFKDDIQGLPFVGGMMVAIVFTPAFFLRVFHWPIWLLYRNDEQKVGLPVL